MPRQLHFMEAFSGKYNRRLYNDIFNYTDTMLSAKPSVNWYLKHQLFQQNIPLSIYQWLMDEKSLTERIIAACSGTFKVDVLNQNWVNPSCAERKLLSTKQRQRVLLRQVVLYCGDQPVVFAHSLIPQKTLRGQHRRLGCLKNKPLGKYLFAMPYLKRSALQWSLIKQSSDLHQLIAEKNTLKGDVWGRRSLFHLKQKKLLVSEYFLPAIHTL